VKDRLYTHGLADVERVVPYRPSAIAHLDDTSIRKEAP